MSVDLEDRLRRHYQERTNDLPTHGPGLDATPSLLAGPWIDGPHRAARVRMALAIGLAAAAIVGVVLLSHQSAERGSIGVTEPQPIGSPALEPTQTLPLGNDVSDKPNISSGGRESVSWYRLQPDLDVAWYKSAANGSTSMFCWRTPADSQCVPAVYPSGPLPMTIPTAGGQTLIVVPGDGLPTSLVARVSDGRALTAPLAWDAALNWGVARYLAPPGASVTLVIPPDVQRAIEHITGTCGTPLREQTTLVATAQGADGGSVELWATPTSTGHHSTLVRHVLAGTVLAGGGCGLVDGMWASAMTSVADGERVGLIDVDGRTDPLATSVRVTFDSGAQVTAAVQTDGYFLTSLLDDVSRFEGTTRLVEPLDANGDPL